MTQIDSKNGSKYVPIVAYTILHRLSYLYVVDIIRMLSQLEEMFHYPMKWEKMEHHGTVTIQKTM